MNDLKNESMNWLIHVNKDFFTLWKSRMESFGGKDFKSLGNNFHTFSIMETLTREKIKESLFSRYCFPIQYMWPTKLNQKGFIEKCAQGIASKFENKKFSNVVVFPLDRKDQKLASNLRGRILQVVKEKMSLATSQKLLVEWTKHPVMQPPNTQTLIVAISEKCVWAGMSSPIDSGCFFAGGRRYVGISNDNIASRAASKFVEGTEALLLNGINVNNSKKWLELGAAPGGITHEIASRNCEVWAIDKAELDKNLLKNPLVHFFQIDARDFNQKLNFDSIFCDLNGPADISAEICSDKTSLLKKEGIIIHTLKVHSVTDFEDDFQKVKSIFKQKGCELLFTKHLYNNKQEVTLFLKKI
ncbi:hypothetical protein GCL60_05565 [Silvanigrella paludirubra]|uniref:Ribosomal RNA methyltransferase FtsJ domain-containing protein n=1 Tax=Silvanigrella paludirubra TaxID=2499159 RepID=A0A6N6VTS7_9BACT|nr:SAM-dependent methyltransferase [Silvanigrella paludirubra]KAB8039730.1 hypothetical protein GCL60_05565 [Silvanigrella paludirubra]